MNGENSIGVSLEGLVQFKRGLLLNINFLILIQK